MKLKFSQRGEGLILMAFAVAGMVSLCLGQVDAALVVFFLLFALMITA